jgi:hypothetical protein
MTPTGALGMGNVGNNSDVGATRSYNSISSQALPQDSSQQEAQEPNAQMNPAEQAIQKFQSVFQSFQTLSALPEYASASKQADDVRTALKNYLEAIVAATSQAGGESVGKQSY